MPHLGPREGQERDGQGKIEKNIHDYIPASNAHVHHDIRKIIKEEKKEEEDEEEEAEDERKKKTNTTDILLLMKRISMLVLLVLLPLSLRPSLSLCLRLPLFVMSGFFLLYWRRLLKWFLSIYR